MAIEASTASSAATSGTPGSSAPSLDPNVQPAQAAAAQSGAATSSSSATQVADFWGKDLFGADGKVNHQAFDRAPDDFKGVGKDFERYKTVDEFLKGYREQRSLLGKKGLVEPLPADAPPEARAERAALLRKVNGVPEKPEDYGIKKPADLPDNFWDQKYADTMAKIAFEEGVSPSALKRLEEANTAFSKEALAGQSAAEKAYFDGQDKLIREWGQKDGLDYAKVQDLARRGAARAGIDPTNPVMKNASVVLGLARIGKLLAEDTLIKGGPGEQSDISMANLTPEQAMAKLASIRDDKNNPEYEAYWQHTGKQHPDHDKVLAKVKKLSAIAYANRPQRGA